ncbi:HK97-gp10 family putative phage morphogenesis protein [Brevibacillus borstelensis]|uniref:HK97-gp10 family putative phage morphogenesis protein n=1 Tax=Brevibacillus borstelensis TaxID=45462 RepID=UPI0030C52A71
MAKSDVELLGIDELMTKLREKLEDGAARVEKNALAKGGELIAGEMRKRVRVSLKTHKHMRDDIKVSGVRTKNGIKFVAVGPGKETGWRAHFLEYGTKKMAAQPFIYPSFHEKKAEALEIMAQEMRKGLT